jgi:hypothetical protein
MASHKYRLRVRSRRKSSKEMKPHTIIRQEEISVGRPARSAAMDPAFFCNSR